MRGGIRRCTWIHQDGSRADQLFGEVRLDVPTCVTLPRSNGKAQAILSFQFARAGAFAGK